MNRHLQRLSKAVPMMILAIVPISRSSAAPLPHSLAHAFDSMTTARQTDTGLGYSVATHGNIIAIGAPMDDIGGEESGVVWVHDATSGALLHRLDNPIPAHQSYFGWSVAVSGSLIAVGVPEDNTGAKDAGIVYVYDLNSATPTVPVHTLENPSPDSDDEFGWAVAISGTRVIVGAPEGDFGYPDAGCAYFYDLASATPTAPLLQVANPNIAGKNFGHAVALAGDSFAVSSVQDAGTGDASRVYVFDVMSGIPVLPLLTLADPSPETNEKFGHAVSMDGSQLVASAPFNDSGATNSGAVHVFDLSSGTPEIPYRTLLNPSPAAEDRFGTSVSISGNAVAVGASLDDPGVTDSGRSYLYDLASATPETPAVHFDNPTPGSEDNFGHAVAIAGTRMVISALYDSTGSNDSGSVYVFDISSGTPNQSLLTINNPSPSSQEEFGASVAISGNIVAVGTPKDDKLASNAGSVSLYDLAAPVPTEPLVRIDNPGPTTNEYFGNAVAASGNLVAVSADHDDTGASNAGIVYIFDATSGTPAVPIRTISNPAPQTSDEFGSAVALEGQILVVGCVRNRLGGFEAGSAYVFDLASATPGVPIATFDNPTPAAGDEFGESVAISGTLVVVGAPLKDNGAIDAGRAYVYDLSSPTPATAIFTLDPPVPAAGNRFGYSVAVSGPYVLVGSPGDDSAAMDAGSVQVFDLASDFPLQPVSLSHPDAGQGALFGSSVAISGTRFLVGAPEDDIIASNSGACYVYDLASATFPTPGERLNTTVQGSDDLFGLDVAIDGTNLLVGSPDFNANTAGRGAAYLFTPDPPSPELQVEQPPGIGLVGGGANIPFGNVPVGSSSPAQAVIVRNIGTADLQVTGISVFGGDFGDFSIEYPPLPVVLPVDQTMVFHVTFAPLVKGQRASSLRIESNAGSGNPFDVSLTGQALSPGDDTDGDGLNDVAELQMESMGFDWQVNDEELLAILQSGANAVGLYSGQQLQAMYPSTPLLSKDPASDQFKLTVSVMKSVDLADFMLFPMEEPQTSVNAQGAFEFRFVSPDPAAFFGLEPR